MNEPHVYKHSHLQIIIWTLIFGLLLAFIFFPIDLNGGYQLIPAAVIVLVMVIFVLSLTQKTIISEDEISSQTLFGTKTLRWSEITRVSGRGHAIKLHNFDGDVTVVPSSNLPRYEEIIEWIGNKRPDLFNPQEYTELKSGSFPLLAGLTLLILLLGLFAGAGLLIYTSPDSATVIIAPLLIFLIIIVVVAGTIAFRPRSLTLDGKSMTIRYLFREKTLLADEIQNIQFTYRQTRNGKIFFILLQLVNRKSLRLSGLNPNLPVVYLVLKNWHGNNTFSIK